MARLSRFVLLALLIAVVGRFSCTDIGPTRSTLKNSVAQTHPRTNSHPRCGGAGRDARRALPKFAPTEPERMLGDAMKQTQGNNDPNALLPALNRILAKYPDYGDGYAMRLGSLCSGKDRRGDPVGHQ